MEPGTTGRPATCTCGKCRKCKHAAYMREWYRRQPKQKRQAIARRIRSTAPADAARYQQRKRDPVWMAREKARWTLRNAIRDGRLTRQPCEGCGASEVHAHHDDYDKPLEVRWLCAECHGLAHRKE